ncbi:uncharacterized protein [Primulina eburnea]|uniref:uncharacterized protein isoform X1 n=2 Tax=Primulina eburnea TaxID=1245227 RepID=UPI003C6C54A3
MLSEILDLLTWHWEMRSSESKRVDEIIMSGQTPNRNQRSKGIKVKHVLQIFLLLAVCFWLIYQVKHSHDKKKEFDESDVKASITRGGSDGFIRLGRKDIRPQEEDAITKNEQHDEEAEKEEETTGLVDENKHEEDELEDKKVEDTENEKVEGGDDEIEDHGQEKLDPEVDREEDFVDGEKERDGDDENENKNEEKDSEDGQVEKESSIEKGDRDGDDTSIHEAREEHYKADDASSAVTHDTQVETTETENQNDENINEQPDNILEETNMGEKRIKLEEGGEMVLDEKHSNVTIGEDKENVVEDSENGSSLITTVREVSDDNLKTGNSSREISTKTRDQEILSEGASFERLNLQSIDVEQANNSIFVMDDGHIASNSTNPNDTKDEESSTLKSSEMSNNTDSSTETNDVIDAQKSDADDGASEILESENTENSEEIQQYSIDVSDSSHSLEETDARLDPDTLPEIQTEGSNTEDAASE